LPGPRRRRMWQGTVPDNDGYCLEQVHALFVVVVP